MISPPGKANLVASYAALIASFQLPPIPLLFVSPFDWFGFSIGNEYPESKWLIQTPSFLEVLKENQLNIEIIINPIEDWASVFFFFPPLFSYIKHYYKMVENKATSFESAHTSTND